MPEKDILQPQEDDSGRKATTHLSRFSLSAFDTLSVLRF
jgi:hypothetical protein